MSEVTKVVSAENAPINNSMSYAKKYEASYEDGGGSSGGAYVVNLSEDDDEYYVCDKTAAEIFEASLSGTVVFAILDHGYGLSYAVTACQHSPDGYTFLCQFYTGGDIVPDVFTATSGTDYPTDNPGSNDPTNT